MNVLDENIPRGQSLLLRLRRLAVRQIAHDVGHQGMSDEDLLPLLRELRWPTFFTRDRDFSRRELCHKRYCLVRLRIGPLEVAKYALRLLRHPDFNTRAKRMGCVICASPKGLRVWRLRAHQAVRLQWND